MPLREESDCYSFTIQTVCVLAHRRSPRTLICPHSDTSGERKRCSLGSNASLAQSAPPDLEKSVSSSKCSRPWNAAAPSSHLPYLYSWDASPPPVWRLMLTQTSDSIISDADFSCNIVFVSCPLWLQCSDVLWAARLCFGVYLWISLWMVSAPVGNKDISSLEELHILSSLRAPGLSAAYQLCTLFDHRNTNGLCWALLRAS